MGVNSLPKTVTRQRRGCDLNPGPTVPESSTLTTRLPSRPNHAVGKLQIPSPGSARLLTAKNNKVQTGCSFQISFKVIHFPKFQKIRPRLLWDFPQTDWQKTLMQLIIGIIIIMFRERNKFFICNKPFHFTLFTKQFKVQMQCVQCNLQQSGRVQQGTKSADNCAVYKKRRKKN